MESSLIEEQLPLQLISFSGWGSLCNSLSLIPLCVRSFVHHLISLVWLEEM